MYKRTNLSAWRRQYSYPLTQWDFHQELVTCGFPLVVLHIILIISFHLWCMRNGGLWMKSNSLTINEPIQNVLHSNLHTTTMHWNLSKHGRFCMHNNQVLTRSHVELEGNYNVHIYSQKIFSVQGDYVKRRWVSVHINLLSYKERTRFYILCLLLIIAGIVQSRAPWSDLMESKS